MIQPSPDLQLTVPYKLTYLGTGSLESRFTVLFLQIPCLHKIHVIKKVSRFGDLLCIHHSRYTMHFRLPPTFHGKSVDDCR